MNRMSKEHWIDAIQEKAGFPLDRLDRVQLQAMSRRQLAVVENLVAGAREDSCSVGCGECEWCTRKNAEAKAKP